MASSRKTLGTNRSFSVRSEDILCVIFLFFALSLSLLLSLIFHTYKIHIFFGETVSSESSAVIIHFSFVWKLCMAYVRVHTAYRKSEPAHSAAQQSVQRTKTLKNAQTAQYIKDLRKSPFNLYICTCKTKGIRYNRTDSSVLLQNSAWVSVYVVLLFLLAPSLSNWLMCLECYLPIVAAVAPRCCCCVLSLFHRHRHRRCTHRFSQPYIRICCVFLAFRF